MRAFSAPLAAIRPGGGGRVSSGAIQLRGDGDPNKDRDIADLIFTGTPAGIDAVVPGDATDVTIGEKEADFA